MGFIRNNKKLAELAGQPLESNYHEWVKYIANTDMPIDFLLAGELAQIQTFAIPSISKILHATRQYEKAGVKRLDDTRAILTECMADTVHSERGKSMVEQLNYIHGHYNISNDDYLYTLALFMLEPVRWCENYGYRQLTNDEKEALYLEFYDLGEAMHIQDIPASYEAMEFWFHRYRKKHMAFNPTNAAVAEGLIRGMQQMAPKWLRPITNSLLKNMILTLIKDDELLTALGLKAPAKPVQWLVKMVMKVRAKVMKKLNWWQVFTYEQSFIYRHYSTYPGGYQPQCLGPDKIMTKRRGGASGCPMQTMTEVMANRV